jgi:integrase/recombinase XerD
VERLRRDTRLLEVQCVGALEHAQQLANHESPKTTKLYDRTSDQITLDEVERIAI